MTCKKSIILLSGGLDCACAFSCEKDNIGLALTFDYGQKAFEQECHAAKKIAEFYNVEHKVIELPWLKNIIKNDVPILQEKDLQNEELMAKTANIVWVPNRNALFINIAATFADNIDQIFDKIIIGANGEEAKTFPDNSESFINAVNECLKYSTKNKVEVSAPLIKYDKTDIIRLAVKNKAPLDFIYSCYKGNKKHCNQCESCLRLERALKTLDQQTYKKLHAIYFEE